MYVTARRNLAPGRPRFPLLRLESFGSHLTAPIYGHQRLYGTPGTGRPSPRMVRSTAMIRPGAPLRSRSSSAASTDRYPLLRRRRNRLRTNSAATSGNRGPRALPASAPDRAAAAPGFRPARSPGPHLYRSGRPRGRYSARPDRTVTRSPSAAATPAVTIHARSVRPAPGTIVVVAGNVMRVCPIRVRATPRPAPTNGPNRPIFGTPTPGRSM